MTMEQTRGERLSEATGAPRAPYLIGGDPSERERRITLTGQGDPEYLAPGVRYLDTDTGRVHVGRQPTRHRTGPAPVEKYKPGVATDPVGIVLMVALTLALLLVAAGEFTVAHYLSAIAAVKP